jgi:hypothetical protein
MASPPPTTDGEKPIARIGDNGHKARFLFFPRERTASWINPARHIACAHHAITVTELLYYTADLTTGIFAIIDNKMEWTLLARSLVDKSFGCIYKQEAPRIVQFPVVVYAILTPKYRNNLVF